MIQSAKNPRIRHLKRLLSDMPYRRGCAQVVLESKKLIEDIFIADCCKVDALYIREGVEVPAFCSIILVNFVPATAMSWSDYSTFVCINDPMQ